MPKPWTGKLVGKMHVNDVTVQDLADELGFSRGYVSMLLNSEREPRGTRSRLEAAYEAVIQRRAIENPRVEP